LWLPYWIVAANAARRPTLSESVLKGSGPSCVTVTRHAAEYFRDAPKLLAKSDAQHATAVAALAIARFQAKSGRLPKDLAALVPEYLVAVPLDPFDGKPIKYKQSDRGVVVYSIGADMVDDGGVPVDEKTEKGDILFAIPKVIRP